MNKTNPLSGLIGNYGDSDDSEDEMIYASEVGASKNNNVAAATTQIVTSNITGIHPAPVPHCPWSACYDESSGFTYYWNQKTNAVTWEAPKEYLLALRIAQHMRNTEVSAEEWQLYQQALAEKQNLNNKVIAKAPITKTTKKMDKPSPPKDKKPKIKKKRPASEDEDEKIELITSYHNSDSESNDETVSPLNVQQPVAVKTPVKVEKKPIKKQKRQTFVFGPSMPPNMNYTVPIGPELPPKDVTGAAATPNTSEIKEETAIAQSNDKEEMKVVCNDEDSQDESSLIKRLKDKAKLLAKLGGDLPLELQQMIRDETNSSATSPKSMEETKNIDIDDLLEEIEKTEFSKIKKLDTNLNVGGKLNSPHSDGSKTPPLEELKALFPSSQNMTDDSVKCLFPSAENIEESSHSKPASPKCIPTEKKENIYLMDINEPIENVGRKKLRISNSVLPERKVDKVVETHTYTTKYSQFIEGFSDQRTGLGFKEEEKTESLGNIISYGNGLTFTKGKTLNEERSKDDSVEDMTDLIEAKLKYLNELRPCDVTPVQEMLIQLQTLSACVRAGAVCMSYVREWVRAACSTLEQHEADAAPPGWTCTFQRSEGRYRYRRDADGLQQWEYPALDNTDMDISTTPPHQPADAKQEEIAEPPLPVAVVPPEGPPTRTPTPPPPPKWHEPPPPGCDDSPRSMAPPPKRKEEDEREIGEELMSFYSDIAELEKQFDPNTASSNSPEPSDYTDKVKSRDMKSSKKKLKVKMSSSMGLKHKSVSTLVAKWQQVADEINSD